VRFPSAALLSLLCGAALPVPGWSQHVNEREPNDSFATATPAALADTLVGVIGHLYDRDLFAINLPGAIRLTVDRSAANWRVEVVVFDSGGAELSQLLDIEGTTVDLPVLRAGRYYIQLSVFDQDDPSATDGATDFAYRIGLSTQPEPVGPGDPTTPVFRNSAAGLARPGAGDANDLWGYSAQGAVTRLSPDGSVTVLAQQLAPSEYDGPYGAPYTLDRSAHVLVPGGLRVDDQIRSFIWRIAIDSGASTVFTSGDFYPSRLNVAVGRDGDVWIGPAARVANRITTDSMYVWRLSPLGDLLDSVNVSGLYLEALALSPAGDLYASGASGVFRLVDHTVRRVIAPVREELHQILFDRDGYVYVVKGSGWNRRLSLYDPGMALVADTFAHLPLAWSGDGEGQVLFAFDRAGNPNGRLLAQDASLGFVELNPSGVRAPGVRLPDLLRVSFAGNDSAEVGEPYSAQLQLEAAPAATQWSVVTGALPPGVVLGEATGALAGSPRVAGWYTVGVRAHSGARYGFARVTMVVAPGSVSVEDAQNALLGGPALSPQNAQLLDQIGNRNGRFDVGDLRAYLRLLGRLAASRN